MSDWTNAERQARFRAKERARVQALERELQALRNGTPEQVQQQVQQLAGENAALRQQLEQAKQALHNASTPQPDTPPASQSDLEARMEFFDELAHYNRLRASHFKGRLADLLADAKGLNEAELKDRLEEEATDGSIMAGVAARIDALYDKIEWRDDDDIECDWNRGEDDDDGDE